MVSAASGHLERGGVQKQERVIRPGGMHHELLDAAGGEREGARGRDRKKTGWDHSARAQWPGGREGIRASPGGVVVVIICSSPPILRRCFRTAWCLRVLIGSRGQNVLKLGQNML